MEKDKIIKSLEIMANTASTKANHFNQVVEDIQSAIEALEEQDDDVTVCPDDTQDRLQGWESKLDDLSSELGSLRSDIENA
jgi:peptidoglycan hydrolase CwlO-like protein